MDIVISKENIQPLRGGRNVSQLSTALQAQSDVDAQKQLILQREEHENIIQNYDGPDPLDPWFNYIQWVEQCFPKHGHEGQIDKLIKDCLSKFENDDRYTQDRRLLRLWIKYIDYSPNPLEGFQLLYNRGIGTTCSELYRAWACYAEEASDYKKADQVYNLGLRAQAQPSDELEEAHMNFQLWYAQRLLHDDSPTKRKAASALAETRLALTSLRTVKRRNIATVASQRTGDNIQSVIPGVVRQHQGVAVQQPRSNVMVDIYQDNPGPSSVAANYEPQSDEAAATPLQSLVQSCTAEENQREVGMWTNSTTKTSKLGTARKLPIKPLAFTLYEDDAVILSSNHLPYCVEDFSDFQVPMCVPDPPDVTKIPMYDKKEVYKETGREPPLVEFSLEEIKARKYLAKYKSSAAFKQKHKAVTEPFNPKAFGSHLANKQDNALQTLANCALDSENSQSSYQYVPLPMRNITKVQNIESPGEAKVLVNMDSNCQFSDLAAVPVSSEFNLENVIAQSNSILNSEDPHTSVVLEQNEGYTLEYIDMSKPQQFENMKDENMQVNNVAAPVSYSSGIENQYGNNAPKKSLVADFNKSLMANVHSDSMTVHTREAIRELNLFAGDDSVAPPPIVPQHQPMKFELREDHTMTIAAQNHNAGRGRDSVYKTNDGQVDQENIQQHIDYGHYMQPPNEIPDMQKVCEETFSTQIFNFNLHVSSTPENSQFKKPFYVDYNKTPNIKKFNIADSDESADHQAGNSVGHIGGGTKLANQTPPKDGENGTAAENNATDGTGLSVIMETTREHRSGSSSSGSYQTMRNTMSGYTGGEGCGPSLSIINERSQQEMDSSRDGTQYHHTDPDPYGKRQITTGHVKSVNNYIARNNGNIQPNHQTPQQSPQYHTIDHQYHKSPNSYNGYATHQRNAQGYQATNVPQNYPTPNQHVVNVPQNYQSSNQHVANVPQNYQPSAQQVAKNYQAQNQHAASVSQGYQQTPNNQHVQQANVSQNYQMQNQHAANIPQSYQTPNRQAVDVNYQHRNSYQHQNSQHATTYQNPAYQGQHAQAGYHGYQSPQQPAPGPHAGFQSPPHVQAGFQSPQQSLPSPQRGFQSPQQGFTSPQQGFTSPQQGYASPQQGFVSPHQNYQNTQHVYQNQSVHHRQNYAAPQATQQSFQSPPHVQAYQNYQVPNRPYQSPQTSHTLDNSVQGYQQPYDQNTTMNRSQYQNRAQNEYSNVSHQQHYASNQSYSVHGASYQNQTKPQVQAANPYTNYQSEQMRQPSYDTYKNTSNANVPQPQMHYGPSPHSVNIVNQSQHYPSAPPSSVNRPHNQMQPAAIPQSSPSAQHPNSNQHRQMYNQNISQKPSPSFPSPQQVPQVANAQQAQKLPYQSPTSKLRSVRHEVPHAGLKPAAPNNASPAANPGFSNQFLNFITARNEPKDDANTPKFNNSPNISNKMHKNLYVSSPEQGQVPPTNNDSNSSETGKDKNIQTPSANQNNITSQSVYDKQKDQSKRQLDFEHRTEMQSEDSRDSAGKDSRMSSMHSRQSIRSMHTDNFQMDVDSENSMDCQITFKSNCSNSSLTTQDIARPAKIDFPRVIDPFNNELCNSLMQYVKFPNKNHYEGYCELRSVPKLQQSTIITLGNSRYSVEKQLGKGTFGTVCRGLELATNTCVALKYQKPGHPWEYYICQEIKARVKDSSMLQGYMDIHSAFLGDNASIFVSELSKYGSLLDVANRVKLNTTKCINETIVMLLASEMLSIVHYLHKAEIIHADIKPDNFLLMNIPDIDSCYPSLQLIDFGCAIDMSLFPVRTTFKKVISTDGFTCTEMRDGRPWTYQTDLYCLAGTVHVILMGNYMQTVNRGGQWNVEKKWPRYMKSALWDKVFLTLLNIKDCSNQPDLLSLKDDLDEHLKSDGGNLCTQLRKFANVLKSR